jgi:hypothetical protein
MEWKMTAPKPGEAVQKTMKGKEYIHCPNHGELKWVLKEGHVGGCSFAEADGQKEKSPDKKKTLKTSKYTKALAHINDDGYDDDDDDDSEEEDENV